MNSIFRPSKMNIWNIRYVPCPPNITVLYDREKLEKICHSTSEKTNLSEIIKPESLVSAVKTFLSKAFNKISTADESLLLEIKCLFSYMYQGGSVHKKEKFLQAIKKVGKCLKRWKDINLTKLLSRAGEMVPEEFFNIHKIRLPSAKLMYFLLHRLIGAFYLLLKTLGYCMEAGAYIKVKMVRGHSIAMTTLGYAMMARIRALVLDICKSIAISSDELHPYIMSMAEADETLVIESLPNNLREELDQFSKKSKAKTSSIQKDIVSIVGYSSNIVTDINVKEATSTDDFCKPKDNEYAVSEDFVYSVLGGGNNDDLGECVTHEKFETLKKLSYSVIEAPESRKKRTEQNNIFLTHKANCNPKLKIVNKKKRKQKFKKKNRIVETQTSGIETENYWNKMSLSNLESKMTTEKKKKLKNIHKNVEKSLDNKKENDWDKSSLSNTESKMTKKIKKKLKNINKNAEKTSDNKIENDLDSSLLSSSEKEMTKKKKKKLKNVNKNAKKEERLSDSDPKIIEFKSNNNKRKLKWNGEESFKKIKRKKMKINSF